ncbi:hypothetical protein RSK20926_14604 [Roseobacter sp. SK209-2-6]|uniref:DUF6455 family protein n=1 Tax=Roseobacter sp. SK209-2-6 TaxID=388739 RepID=UPI0000F3D61F|nr:DUF6455 family protein [Roseobacter sp. SK209-2-6]EBA15870.1 hypothetical protein RSK20926_14604 [Roseobacter sp. SK209-2-6]
MREHSTLKTHAALLDQMGRALGLDLQDEAISGRLQFDEISEAVLRCTRCGYPERCRKCVSTMRHAALAQAPDYCRNGDLLAYLKEQRV